MEAIIISGLPASGKTVAAESVGKTLGIEALSGSDILREMAAGRGYNPIGKDWWDTEEGLRFLEERKEDLNFDRKADDKLKERIKKGSIAITSYTAPWISEYGYKVWLIASIENRAKRMMNRDKTTMKEALDTLKIRDDENTKLYKRLYGIDFGMDMKPFNLIINTNNLNQDDVAEQIIENYNKRQGKR